MEKALLAARGGDLSELDALELTWAALAQPLNSHGDTLPHILSRTPLPEALSAVLERAKRVSPASAGEDDSPGGRGAGHALEVRNRHGHTPLHEAALASSPGCVLALLQHGAAVDALKHADWTPLHLACTKPSADTVRALLEQGGASVDLVNRDGWNALHIACRTGDPAIIKALLEKNPDCWNTRSTNGRTPLHTAALHGAIEAARILFEHGAPDVNARDSCGATPLHSAVAGGFVDMARFLIDRGAQPSLEDNSGRLVCSGVEGGERGKARRGER